MSRFLTLLRLNFKAMLAAIALGGRKKKAFTGWGALALIAGLGVYMSAIYSFAMSQALLMSGGLWLLPGMMAILSALMSFLLTMFSAGGMIFGNKDADFMLALPVSAFEVMLSKILALCIENLVMAEFIMIPMAVVYLINGGSSGALFVVLTIVAAAFLSLLPTTLGVIVGYVFALISGKLRRKALIQNILYILFFGFIMVGSFRINTIFSALATGTQGVERAFSGWLLPFGLFTKAVGGDLLSLLLFIAITVLPLLLIVWLFSRRYKSIITSLFSHMVRSDYKLGTVQSASQFSALLHKESARFFGTPAYMINSGFGIIMGLLAAGAAVVKRDMLLGILSEIGGSGLMPVQLLAVVMCFMAATVNTTCVSISLEGRNLWILKEAPISARTLFGAKALFNLIVSLPVMLICTLVLGWALEIPAAQVAMVAALLAVICCYVAVSGLMFNLLFPKLDADNETIVIKQSASAMLGILGGMLLVVALAVIYGLLLAGRVDFTLYCAIIALVLAAVSALIWYRLTTRGEKLLLELN